MQFAMSFLSCLLILLKIYKLMVLVLHKNFFSLFFLFACYLNQCWDMGKGFKIPEVYRTGYTVIGLSIVTSIALAFLWAQHGKIWAETKAEEGAEGNVDWTHCGSICVYVLAYCRPHFIRVLNKRLYYAVCRKCVVMFCPPELIIVWKASGSSNAARVQSACKCDPVYFTLVLNNWWPKLDVSYMLHPYVICLLVLWRQIY